MQALPHPQTPRVAAFAPALPADPPRVAATAHWLTRPVVAPRPLRRVFVVGCPRSGTTIVQAQLAAQGALMTLPETHFFQHLLGGSDADGAERNLRRWTRRLLYTRPDTHRRLAEALQPLLQGRPLRRHVSGRGYVREFLGLLDAAASAQQAAGWLEKTPQHFVYIDLIKAMCPDAVFIHVMRAGEDVVASAVEAEMQYTASHSFSGGVAHWVGHWNRAAETHLRYAGQPGHHVVAHEELVQSSDATLARLLAFTGLHRRASAAPVPHVADLRSEPWKRDAVGGQIVAPARKFEALFGPQAQAWIRSQLHDYLALRAEVARRQG